MGLQCNVLMHYHRPMYTINPTDSPLSAFDPALPIFIPGDGKNPPSAFFGLSRRDYFAAYAPDDIPDWFSFPKFEHASDPYDFISRHPLFAGLSEALQGRVVRAVVNGGGMSETIRPEIGTDKVREFAVDWFKERDRCRVLYENWQADRYFAWRYYYADRMLAQGKMK